MLINSHLHGLLCSADLNGCRAGSVTEIVFETRSAAREFVATPTAVTVIAEADVAGSRQAVCTRGVKASCSTIVYLTGTSAAVADSLGTERHH